ncbi:hypothetical protein INT45_001361 [Circinella minor]|uniref:3'-5' exonuclease domain-containing protein n=1 Tax=Circinella minor TaxID=1195481 RepID=A0A8H7VIT2_9FUNG|nr:hypothetical protein INT45_001361 [Circinella minor]
MDNDDVSSPEKRGPGRPFGSKNKPKCKRLPAGQTTLKDIVTNPSVLSQIRIKPNKNIENNRLNEESEEYHDNINDGYFSLKDLVAEIEEDDEGHEINKETTKEMEEDEVIPNTIKSIENKLKSYNERNNGVLANYFSSIVNRIKVKDNGYPSEYRRGTFWVEPKAPFFALREQNLLNPTPLYYPRVFLWLPHLLIDKPLSCSEPGCKEIKLDYKGFFSDPCARRVVDMHRCFYIISYQYICPKCKTTIGSSDEKILKQLPDQLSIEFPAILTHRCAISNNLIDILRPCIQHGMGIANFHEMLQELHTKRHTILHMKYTLAHLYCKESQQTLFESWNNNNNKNKYHEFSTFDDAQGYGGYIPSVTYFQLVYTAILDVLRPFMDKQMTAVGGEILKGDHTFKFIKKIAKMGNQPTFGALYTICNEYEEIRLQLLVPTKSLHHLKTPFEEMMKTYRQYGYQPPRLFLTDNVRGDKLFLQQMITSLNDNSIAEASSSAANLEPESLTEQIESFIKIPDNVNINYIRSALNADDIIKKTIVNDSVSKTIVIGLDCEWNYAIGTRPRNVAIVQISYKNDVLVLPVHQYDHIPLSLKTILESPKVLKASRNITGDLNKLSCDYHIIYHKSTVLELGKFCRRRGYIDNGTASLSTIAKSVLGGALDKGDRNSNWEALNLSSSQIYYSALYAWASLAIYTKLEQVGVIGKPVSNPVPEGAYISVYPSCQWFHPVAFGKIISANNNIQDSCTQFCINRVSVPGAIIDISSRTLSDFGQPPFIISLPTSMLRFEKKSLCQEQDNSIPPINNAIVDRAHNASPPLSPTILAKDLEDKNNLFEDENSSSSEDEEINHTYGQAKTATLPRTQRVIPQQQQIQHPRVLKYIYHFMALIKIPRQHVLAKEFARRLRDAVFVVDKDDRKKVEEYLGKKGLTWAYIMNTNASWILRRVKRVVPSPDELGPVVQELFDEYGNLICVKTGRTLFDKNAWKQADNMIKAIYEGQISDHPDVPLYYKIGFDKKAGLSIYRCCRGTNSLEGGVHQNIIRAIGSSGAGPHMADCFLAEYRLRHNIKVGSMNRYQKPHKSHYDLWMIEALLYLQMKPSIFCSGGAIVDQSSIIYSQGLHLRSSNETFGIGMFSEKYRHSTTIARPLSVETTINLFLPDGSTSNLLNKRYKFLAQKQGTKYAVTPIHTPQELEKFRKFIKEPAKGSISANQWVDLSIQWNKSISQPVDGVVIFYKTPEHLKIHYEHWNVKRIMGASIAISNRICEVMHEELQSPERSSPVLVTQTPSPPPLGSLSSLPPSPLSASWVSAIPSSSSMPSASSPSITAVSPGPSIRKIEPASSQPIPLKPLFSVNVTIPKKRARHR